MGGETSKPAVAATTDNKGVIDDHSRTEINRSEGFHLVEFHAGSVLGTIGTLLLLVVFLVALCACCLLPLLPQVGHAEVTTERLSERCHSSPALSGSSEWLHAISTLFFRPDAVLIWSRLSLSVCSTFKLVEPSSSWPLRGHRSWSHPSTSSSSSTT